MRVQDELYACYLLTPMLSLPAPDWELLDRIVEGAGDEDGALPTLLRNVGVSRAYIRNAATDPPADLAGARAVRCKRLYLALQLHEAINERPVAEVAARYGVERGELQARMQSAGMFAATVVAFCRRMEMWQLETLLGAYATRFDFGVRADIAPLMEIAGVGPARARDLFGAGYTTVEKIAAALPQRLLVAVPSFLRVGLAGAQRIVENAKRVLRREAWEAVTAANVLLQRAGEKAVGFPVTGKGGRAKSRGEKRHEQEAEFRRRRAGLFKK